MQPGYSFAGVTEDLQDLILREPCLQALVHEVHHLTSWGETDTKDQSRYARWGLAWPKPQSYQTGLVLVCSPSNSACAVSAQEVHQFKLKIPTKPSPEAFWNLLIHLVSFSFPRLNPRGFCVSASRHACDMTPHLVFERRLKSGTLASKAHIHLAVLALKRDSDWATSSSFFFKLRLFFVRLQEEKAEFGATTVHKIMCHMQAKGGRMGDTQKPHILLSGSAKVRQAKELKIHL